MCNAVGIRVGRIIGRLIIFYDGKDSSTGRFAFQKQFSDCGNLFLVVIFIDVRHGMKIGFGGSEVNPEVFAFHLHGLSFVPL